MTLVISNSGEYYYHRKHVCPECGHIQYSSVSFGSKPSRESLVVSTWNHNCFNCGNAPTNSCYIDDDENMITINEILGEETPADRAIVIGSTEGYGWEEK